MFSISGLNKVDVMFEVKGTEAARSRAIEFMMNRTGEKLKKLSSEVYMYM